MTALLVLASQAAIHVGMVEAPWALGLRIHHQEALVSPSMAVAHAVAALVLVVAVCWLDRLLDALSRVVRALSVGIAGPPRANHLVLRAAAPGHRMARATGLRRAIPVRGPPLPA